jgi:hypothetical protein
VTVDYASIGGTAGEGSDYTPVSGTLSLAPGTTSITFTVPISDDAEVEADETVQLSLSNPANAVLGDPATATLTIVDNDLPRVRFGSSNYRVNERRGAATIRAVLTSTSPQTVTVDYASIGGTAGEGSDYTPVSGTLTFAPGTTSITFTMPISDDAEVEADETVRLSLSNPTNATLGGTSATTVTIVDDDRPLVEFGATSYIVDERSGAATLTATLSATTPQTVTVGYRTQGGTATAGGDYTPISDTLTFEPGTSTVTFTIPISDDTLVESEETFRVRLLNPINARLGTTRSVTVTIVRDEVEVAFSSPAFTVDERAGAATITATLSSTSTQTITVDYATSNGSAIAGNDYTPVSGTLTFEPGTSAVTFTIPIRADAVLEPDETVQLSLNNPDGGVLGSRATAILTIVNNGGSPPKVYLPIILKQP